MNDLLNSSASVPSHSDIMIGVALLKDHDRGLLALRLQTAYNQVVGARWRLAELHNAFSEAQEAAHGVESQLLAEGQRLVLANAVGRLESALDQLNSLFESVEALPPSERKNAQFPYPHRQQEELPF